MPATRQTVLGWTVRGRRDGIPCGRRSRRLNKLESQLEKGSGLLGPWLESDLRSGYGSVSVGADWTSRRELDGR